MKQSTDGNEETTERNGVVGVGREGWDGDCGVDRVTENVIE